MVLLIFSMLEVAASILSVVKLAFLLSWASWPKCLAQAGKRFPIYTWFSIISSLVDELCCLKSSVCHLPGSSQGVG